MMNNKNASTLMPHLTFDSERLLEHAFQTGFCKRLGKIHPRVFWETFCLEAIHGTLSYNDMAAKMEARGAPSVSRQAVGKKVTPEAHRFFERMLSSAMAEKIDKPTLKRFVDGCAFERIMVQDSTVIRLPADLYPVFSGVKNGHSTVCNARVQGVYDILAGEFLQYSIDPYSRNDMVAAHDFLPQPGDLVLKDRGYYKTDVIAECIEQKADCIFRYKHNSALYCVGTDKKFDLARTLKKHGSIDMIVDMGGDNGTRVPVRILGFPVPEEVANRRRMKAKKEVKGRDPSKELLHLMGWAIYITTLSKERVSAEQIAELYSLRWKIENIFKTWKSNFGFDHIHTVSEPQLRMLLVARLTVIVLLHHQMFIPLELALDKQGYELSLMKFMRYAQKNLLHVLLFLSVKRRMEDLVPAMIRYCSMDKRKRKSLRERRDLTLAEIAPNA